MPQQNRGVLVIGDGMGDRPAAALDGLTPLQAARTPRLDALVAGGICGQVDPVFPGLPLATHTGTAVLIGLPIRDVFDLSRGPVEAAGAGMTLEPGDVAVRCNWATVQQSGDGLAILDRRAGRIRDEIEELAAALEDIPCFDGVTTTFRQATQHRAVLRLSGAALSAEVTDTDPGSRAEAAFVLPCRARHAEDSAAERTAEALNRFIHEAHRRLEGHPVNVGRAARGEAPANAIITRGAGKARKLKSLINHLDLKAALVAAERTVLGLGELFKYDVLSDEAFSALPDTDLHGKVARVQEALSDHDVVFLHVKGADICAHDRDPVAKREFFERLDEALAPLLEADFVVGVCSDHSTNSMTGLHCGDPVPAALRAPGGRVGPVRVFNETACMGGGLGRLTSNAFLTTFLDAMGAIGELRAGDRHFFQAG